MAERVDRVVRHLLPAPCSQHAMSPLDSPTGKLYPEGTDENLKGGMEPVSEEAYGELTCVHGALPQDLDGFFLRNGPNPAFSKEGMPYHAFDGDAMIHLCQLSQGKATYRNRWVQTKRLALEKELGREPQLMEKLGEDSIFMGAANTNLVYHAKKLMAVFETDRPYMLSLPDLETLGQQTYGGALKHSMTAHPKVCPVTGEMFFFGYDMLQPMLHFGVVSPDGELKLSLDVPTKCGLPVMMHDMAITENYVILMEFPLCFQRRLAKQGLMPYAHDTSKPSWFGIMPRHATSTEQIRWFKGQTGVAFHTANAWEEGQKVRLVACFANKFAFFDPEDKDDQPSHLHEWTFDLNTGETREGDIGDANKQFDFVQINPSRRGQSSRYVWGSMFVDQCFDDAFHSIEGLAKHDLASGKLLEHKFAGGRFGGEAVFAARANPSSEDDGYLLCLTYNPHKKVTELYVVDAKTMDPNPVAILQTPHRVPFGFHAYWLPTSMM